MRSYPVDRPRRYERSARPAIGDAARRAIQSRVATAGRSSRRVQLVGTSTRTQTNASVCGATDHVPSDSSAASFTRASRLDILLFVSGVTEIQEAITRLSAVEQRQLAQWFEEALEQAWDNQIEADVAAGRLDHLIARAETDIAAGRVKPLDEVLGNG